MEANVIAGCKSDVVRTNERINQTRKYSTNLHLENTLSDTLLPELK